MVVCEILFFLYWQFWNMEGYGAWDVVIAETSNLLFFDVLVLPYLILNRYVNRCIDSDQVPFCIALCIFVLFSEMSRWSKEAICV